MRMRRLAQLAGQQVRFGRGRDGPAMRPAPAGERTGNVGSTARTRRQVRPAYRARRRYLPPGGAVRDRLRFSSWKMRYPGAAWRARPAWSWHCRPWPDGAWPGTVRSGPLCMVSNMAWCAAPTRSSMSRRGRCRVASVVSRWTARQVVSTRARWPVDNAAAGCPESRSPARARAPDRTNAAAVTPCRPAACSIRVHSASENRTVRGRRGPPCGAHPGARMAGTG